MVAPTYASEHLLCADFTAAATEQGWTVYPETSGFDLLLVKEGIQLGVEAKLRPSMELLNQIAVHLDPHFMRSRGPHYVAALVPGCRGQWDSIARVMGFTVISPVDHEVWPTLDARIESLPPLHFTEPAWLPPVVPSVAAGVSSPIRLTKWKWDALRLLARLSIRGYVTAADFKNIGIHPSRWYSSRWIVPVGEGKWAKSPGQTLADDQHPAEFLVAVEREREALARFDTDQQTGKTLPLFGTNPSP